MSKPKLGIGAKIETTLKNLLTMATIRKAVFVALFVLLLTTFSACLPRTRTPEPPCGVWKSEDPHIVLYLRPEYRIPIDMPGFIGLYTIDGVETKVFARFGNGSRFTIRGVEELSQGGRIRNLPIITGRYRVHRVPEVEIHYNLSPVDAERLGMTTITFRRVRNHDPIDPYYWFPRFFPRTE